MKLFRVIREGTIAKQNGIEQTLWYCSRDEQSASGALSIYIDDGLGSQDAEIKKVIDTIADNFEMGKRGSSEFDHLGFHLTQKLNVTEPQKTTIEWSGPNYVVEPVKIEETDADGKRRILDTLATRSEYQQFRTSLGRLSWISALVARAAAP